MSDKNEIIYVVNNPGEDKPWEIKFDDVDGFKTARALLNHPVHKFDTEQEAVEVAEKLKNIIKAEGVEVDDTSDEVIAEVDYIEVVEENNGHENRQL